MDTNNTGELTICEGIENALAGVAAGFRPVWSVGEDCGLSSCSSIYRVSRLNILVSEDSPELRRTVKIMNRYRSIIIELFTLTTNKNVDGNFSITSSPTPRWRNKKQPEKKDIQDDDVDEFFE
jgi:hypothetical protein